MPTFKKPLVAIALAISVLSSPCVVMAAPALPGHMEQFSTVEGMTEYHLPNGLKVLLMPDQSQANITVNMTYLVGSRHENTGQTGYAHLLEHMLCRGSKNYPHIAAQLSGRGMHWNAFTHLDFTHYITTFEASETDLQWLLGLEADRMQHAEILQRELDIEMTVVRNELEFRETNPHGILLKRIQAVAYDWHGYGHSTIGEKSDIENTNIGQLRQLYETYYRPDNAVLLVTGKFDTTTALQTIAQKFATVPAPTTSLPNIPTVEPAQQGERQVIVRQKADHNAMVLAYHKPPAAHPDFAALKVAGAMLSSGREQRDRNNVIFLNNVSPSFHMLGYAQSGLALFATDNTAGSTSEDSSKFLIKTVESFGQHPLSQDELDFIKSRFRNQFSRMINDTEALSVALSDYIAAGDWRLLFVEKDRIASLTTRQVEEAAKHYFVRENRTVGLLLSEEKSQSSTIPAAPPVAELMQKFSHKDEYAPVTEFNSSIENVSRNTKRFKIGNIDVSLLRKPSRGQEVAVELVLHWGDETSLFNKRWTERMTDLVMLNGVNQYGKEALEAEREKSHIRGGLTKFTTDKAHLDQALQLMILNLKEPSLAQARTTIDKEVRRWYADRGTPVQLAQDEFAKHFSAFPPGDIRALETSQQIISELNAIKPVDVIDFYKQFYGASSGHLAIVGDFDTEQAQAILEKELPGWESKAPYRVAHGAITNGPPLDKFIDTPGKDNGYFLGRIDLPVSINDADYAALVVANYLLGNSPADSRLGKRVRQKEGWSYHVASKFDAQLLEPVASWQIVATAASPNVNKLKQAIMEELRLLDANGFSEGELQKAKSALVHMMQQSRNSNINLAGQLSQTMHIGEDFGWFGKRETQLQSLNLEQLNRVTRKYLQPASWSIVTTGDRSKMGKSP